MEPFSQQFQQRLLEGDKRIAERVPPRFDADFRARLYDLLRWR
jgi:hypothetical protein